MIGEAVPIGHPDREFARYFAAERNRIGRALALTLGDEALGFEAVDEAMTRAYGRWSSVSAMTNPNGWIYRTGLNWARSILRRRRRSAFKDFLVSRPDRATDTALDTDLAGALARLDDDRRAVVILRYYLDWPVDQVATALGIAPGTVKSRLSRALDQMQNDRALAGTTQGSHR